MAPVLVQTASGTVTSGNLTVTLSSPTTGGNCLVALIGSCADSVNGTISGITLGGAADNWAQSAIEGSGGDHAISSGWADPNCAAGQTSVVISQTGGSGTVQGLMAYVMEWSGLGGTVDVSSGQSSSGFVSSWTSGTTGATGQASEVAFGLTCGASNTRGPGLTGPSSPWTNETLLVVAGTSRDKFLLCGYNILSSTGTQVYAGTSSPTTTNDTLVYTLKAGGPVSHNDTGALTVTPARANTLAHGHNPAGALTVTPAGAAARLHAAVRGPALAVTPVLAASRLHAATIGAALVIRPSFGAATSGGRPRGGNTPDRARWWK